MQLYSYIYSCNYSLSYSYGAQDLKIAGSETEWERSRIRFHIEWRIQSTVATLTWNYENYG